MITNLENLCQILEEERSNKKTILFIGTFNLSIKKYLQCLKNAKMHGGILVVAIKHKINNDNKGDDDFYQRASTINALDFVDYVIRIECDTLIAQETKDCTPLQKEEGIDFENIIMSIKPNIIYREIPESRDIRKRVFEKYHLK